MASKEELIIHIKNWIEVDNQIAEFQKQIKLLREQKKSLSMDLMDIMKTNEIDCFNVKDGKLMYTKSKIKKPINKKSLMTAVNDFFKNDSDTAKELSDHILNSREETVKESIKRKKE